MAPDDAAVLVDVLLRTNDPAPQVRNAAAAQLGTWLETLDTPEGGVLVTLLLNIATTSAAAATASSSSSSVSLSDNPSLAVAQQAAAVTFKNITKQHWDPRATDHPVHEAAKAEVRARLFGEMLRAPRHIRRLLAEAIVHICKVDFPETYPAILDDIIAVLRRAVDAPVSQLVDPSVSEQTIAALDAAHSVFTRYRQLCELSEEIKSELLNINAATAEILIALLRAAGQAASSVAVTDAVAGAAMVDVLRLTIEVLHDLTTCDLGAEHESALPTIVSGLEAALQLRVPELVGDAYNPGPLIQMEAAALDLVAYYMQQFDEEMEPFALGLLTVVWQLLCSSCQQQGAADDLVVSGLSFFESTCRSVHRVHLPPVIPQLCSSVILPCLMISDRDVEDFEADPLSYVQRDVEGSDGHTRRHAACRLAKTLTATFPNEAVPALQGHIEMLTSEKSWRSIDAAVTLVTAIALRVSGATCMEHGAAAAELTGAVDVASFYAAVVEPELCRVAGGSSSSGATRRHDDDTSAEACLVRADAIRFAATFRHFLPIDGLVPLATYLADALLHPCVVVHTYAALTIDRLLSSAVERFGIVSGAPQHQPQQHELPDVPMQQLNAATPRMLELLCVRLQHDTDPNEYITRCLARVLRMTPTVSGTVLPAVCHVLAEVLNSVARQPKNPLFSHYLFEALAACLHTSPPTCAAVHVVEGAVWNGLMFVLAQDVAELLPYTFQILSAMLEQHYVEQRTGVPSPSTSTVASTAAPSMIPDQYMALYGPLLSPPVFAHRGNVPAAVRLITAFVRCNGGQLHTSGFTGPTVKVASRFIASRLEDHFGFDILNAVVLYYPDDAVRESLPTVFRSLFDRMQRAPTHKYSRMLAIFCCSVIVARGGMYFIGATEHIQVGMTGMVLTRIIFPTVAKVTGALERKLCAVGLTKLLDEARPLLQQQQYDGGRLWGECVLQCLQLLHFDAVADEAAEREGPLQRQNQVTSVIELQQQQQHKAIEDSGLGNRFVPLANAPALVDDPCGAIADAAAYFRSVMKSLAKTDPESIHTLGNQLPPDALRALTAALS